MVQTNGSPNEKALSLMEPLLITENLWEVKAPLADKAERTTKARGYIRSKAFGCEGESGWWGWWKPTLG